MHCIERKHTRTRIILLYHHLHRQPQSLGDDVIQIFVSEMTTDRNMLHYAQYLHQHYYSQAAEHTYTKVDVFTLQALIYIFLNM